MWNSFDDVIAIYRKKDDVRLHWPRQHLILVANSVNAGFQRMHCTVCMPVFLLWAECDHMASLHEPCSLASYMFWSSCAVSLAHNLQTPV